MTYFKKFLLTLLIGGAVLLNGFAFHQPAFVFAIVAFTGGILAFLMFLEIIKMLHSGRYGIDVLVITAILATLIAREYWASLVILIMLTDGDSLEDYANKRAGKKLQSLLDNTPRIAHRFKGGRLQDIVIDKINTDDQLLVKPGELVPADSRVTKGEPPVDESSLTDEPRPETKKPEDQITSGPLNGDGSIQMIAEKRATNSQYQVIIELVEESKEKPVRFVRLVDRHVAPFTLIAYLIDGTSWWFSKDLLRFAEVLVVASPCPLILAALTALTAGTSHSSKNGIVIKTEAMIEKLARIKTITFDKTGTLTKGILEVEAIQSVNGIKKEELLLYTTSAEQESNHILARSLMNNVRNNQLYPVNQLKEMAGQGVQAVVNNHEVKTGCASFVSVEEIEASNTAIYVTIDRSFAGTILSSDQIRLEAVKTIKELRKLDVRNLMMTIEDGSAIAQMIAKKVQLDSVYARSLSQDKLIILESTLKDQRPVAMVGDGMSDALALAAADIGIAMEAYGSITASESVDAVILKDNLLCVAKAIVISRDMMRIAEQSVLIGISTCIFLMLIANMGLAPTLFGAVLQEVVGMVSILNVLRVKKNPVIFPDSVSKTNIV